MRMKRTTLIGFVLALFLGLYNGHSQRKRNFNAYSELVPKTLVGKFEFDMDMDQIKKDSLRQKYVAHIMELKNTIDTLEISDKRRQRLLLTLQRNPFDEKLLELTAFANSHK